MLWGRLLQIVGVGLVISAFAHFSVNTNSWVTLIGGVAIAFAGFGIRRFRPGLGVAILAVGAVLAVLAFVHPLMVQWRQIWVDGLAGVAAWLGGWWIVRSESRGPWHLGNRPSF
jgi:hypothetical protein